MRKNVSIDFTERELSIMDSALVRYHNSILDRRRKLRPSERALWLAEVKRLLERIRDAA